VELCEIKKVKNWEVDTMDFPVYDRNSDINVGMAALGLKFVFNFGGAAYEARSAKWNLGTNSKFTLKRGEKKLDRVVRNDL
jgi:hypothetical protein